MTGNGLAFAQPSGAVQFGRGRHRLLLWRCWGEGEVVNFICLNPSTAGDFKEDATTRKLRGFAERWGFGAYTLTNLFTLRSTDPRGLLPPENYRDLLAPLATATLRRSAARAQRVVLAWGRWGAHLKLRWRAEEVVRILRDEKILPWHFQQNADGSYAHPLMLPYSTELKQC